MTTADFRTVYQIEGDRIPDRVAFGGEYSFRKADDLKTVHKRLFDIGCEMGGSVVKWDDRTLQTFEPYRPGFWELQWDDPACGVSRIIYKVPAEA